MKVPVLFLGFLTAALFSCASHPGVKKTSQGLYGMIYDGDHKPVREVKIYVGDTLRALSDIHGHFSLGTLKTGKNYRIKALKDNYEEAELDLYYTDPQNVLYINMSHRDQLLGRAEQALREGDWAPAASLLARAEALGRDHSPALYLRAALAFRRGEYDEALDLLAKLEETEGNAPHVHLFIADLCQYFTGDSGRAAASLQKFLDLRQDPEIAERLQGLLAADSAD
jgi:tetratricopeptide (TPR) repeat protein